MKFPSIVRLPRNKRFEFRPRYYDPIREEIEERTARIRREVDAEKSGEYAASAISFRKNSKIKSAPASRGMLQILIFLLLLVAFYGYIFLIDWLIYVPLVLLPIYFFLKYRRKN